MNRNSIEPGQPPQSQWRYEPDARFYDEATSAPGVIRSHWEPIAEQLFAIGPKGLARRWQEGRRLIHDHGVTYNVYGDPKSNDRPWPLDPLPFVLSSAEWNKIESAIVQRATLLNSILADCYGPQKLLANRKLPAELVYANPGFLRPCRGVELPDGVHLHMYAADLARSPNGQWWVISDRTQAPSGAGYALENRLVSSRVLPDVFKATNVERLAGFFQNYRDALLKLVPRGRQNPRIVLLTPGPFNETYFEHAFLARYLGYTLVEGGDLTVRDQHVYLKTLAGLLPVDVVLRRLDDTFCDPLEFRADSMLGVPGLLQAVRAGNVSVANALGSGLVESAAPAGFLPSLCRHMLGEDLRMPTVATWWCGQKAPLEYVVEHLDGLVIKKAFPKHGDQVKFGARLNAAERKELITQMRARPAEFVAQEQVALSTSPVWDADQIQSRHIVLRVYAVAANGTYHVMPGGLTRVTPSHDNLVVSVQQGGGSKDTWVLADAPPAPFSLLPAQADKLPVSRATFDLPSRVADNLYWLGRYLERVESSTRIARTMLPRLTQDPGGLNAGLQAGSRMLRALGCVSPEGASLETELDGLIFESAQRGSLGWDVHQAHTVAWSLRDRISSDAWRVLSRLELEFQAAPPPAPLRLSGALGRLNQTILTLAAFAGMSQENMTRGEGWRFLDIGRRLERALQMIEMVRQCFVEDAPIERGEMEAMLEIADSSLTYRSRYLNTLQPDLILDLLLLDDANPRSVAFQLAQLRHHVDLLPESLAATTRPPEVKLLMLLQTEFQLADVNELSQTGPLSDFLYQAWSHLRELSDLLTRTYFTHSIPSRQLAAQ